MLKKRFLCACLVALFCASFAGAQLLEDYRFKGKIVDTSKKPIPKVRVTFRNVESGKLIVFETNADGTFDKRMIPHAVYDVTFEKTGYVTRKEHFDWSEASEGVIVKDVEIVMESEALKAQEELGAKVAKLYREAYSALSEGNCDTASKKAQELIAAGAGSHEYAARFVVARCLAVKGETDAAVKEYDRVIALKDDLFEAHFDLATLLEKRGEHDSAVKEYEKAAALKPEDAETQYSLGAILFRKEDFEAAAPHLQKALELNPAHSQANKAMGFVCLYGKEKNIPKSIECLKKYVELEPNASDTAQIKALIEALGKQK
jgi:tetratricopeptide (TPR) repeat protein